MLPIKTSYEPMEAELVEILPDTSGWQFEPKWDGFRCLIFKDGNEAKLISKSGKPLDRYFPELQEAIVEVEPARFVLDSEIVVPIGETFSFDDLLQRIHPAASRVKKLAKETPAIMMVFDILVDEDGDSLADEPLSKRRERLEGFAKRNFHGSKTLFLSPATTDPRVTEEWRNILGERLDGIMAKKLSLPYQSGTRKGMLKVKRMRTADCVVGGFRYATGSRQAIGSLLLGLYDERGLLNHVGFTSAFNAREKKELLQIIEPLIGPPGFDGDAPGGPSRWSSERSTEWEPLKPELVVEVRYDHFTQGRFRHGTKIIRWRTDKRPNQCTYEQLSRVERNSPVR
jgi:ATP-dependent DNA ligase